MADELKELCPLQFIEGRNENIIYTTPAGDIEFPSDDPSIPPFLKLEGKQWAILYVPGMSYTLTDVEILGRSDEKASAKKHPAGIYTDYGDAPSYNCVTEGELVVQADTDVAYWANIQLKPVVVFSKQKYWLVFEDNAIKFTLAYGKKDKGVAVPYTSGNHGQWATPLQQKALFLKFHGRVMPVVT